jgi:hypothetical protein
MTRDKRPTSIMILNVCSTNFIAGDSAFWCRWFHQVGHVHHHPHRCVSRKSLELYLDVRVRDRVRGWLSQLMDDQFPISGTHIYPFSDRSCPSSAQSTPTRTVGGFPSKWITLLSAPGFLFPDKLYTYPAFRLWHSWRSCPLDFVPVFVTVPVMLNGSRARLWTRSHYKVLNQGVSADLEGLVAHISAPLLNTL